MDILLAIENPFYAYYKFYRVINYNCLRSLTYYNIQQNKNYLENFDFIKKLQKTWRYRTLRGKINISIVVINKIIIMTAYSIGKATKQRTILELIQRLLLSKIIRQVLVLIRNLVILLRTNHWNKQSKIVALPSPSMSKAKKFFSSLQKFENVGPGTYNPQKSQSKIAPTLKGKPKNNFNNDVPSPDK